MICTVDGKQYEIPSHIMKGENHSAMIKTASGIVTEYDIDRVDEVATTVSWPDDWIEVQRMRLYFELPDGSITQTPPLGIKAGRLDCCWRVVGFSKNDWASVVWAELRSV